jgi:hypothetical protein
MIDLGLVKRPFPSQREPAPRWLSWVALALSLLSHVGALVLSFAVLRPPELDVEFELPMDVELGTAEAIAAAALPPPASEPAASGQTSQSLGAGAGDAGLAQADAAAADAGVADAAAGDAAASDAGARSRTRDAGALQASVQSDAGVTAPRLPPGAQIALRVDLARIRKSPVAGDVRSLLGAIPDWKALLEGSGIDPIEQVDRLLIATPNLQRDKIVLAGRYVGGEQVVRDAVQRLASARGEPALWHAEGNVQVAPWLNPDPTPRVVALVGPQHFTISRPEDLARVLAIAAARSQRTRRGAPKGPVQHPADALLSMEEGEGLSVEVEGAAQFVRRGRRGVPERLRLSAMELPGARIELRGTLSYLNEANAEDARAYWTELQQRYASNTLVALLGLSAPLENGSVRRSGQDVRVEVVLTADQLRLILGYVRELLSPPGARP